MKELINQELATLNEEQLKQVVDFIAFLKFRDRCATLRENESKLAAIYSEFAEEDQLLAEEGMGEYAEMLRRED
ncbi:hypothetical protein ACE1B6_13100 [Aerosakkonemataceae cyanobacterium BLCC-F154]|uniref:DUF2281 domain-containing protein n=1 Tax=Floridaenema fluviatile BLCC-F154 TaxID=3153640 RepID=A0ABV4YBJ3_9CYAN